MKPGGAPIDEPYKYVPRDSVGFLRLSVLK